MLPLDVDAPTIIRVTPSLVPAKPTLAGAGSSVLAVTPPPPPRSLAGILATYAGQPSGGIVAPAFVRTAFAPLQPAQAAAAVQPSATAMRPAPPPTRATQPAPAPSQLVVQRDDTDPHKGGAAASTGETGTAGGAVQKLTFWAWVKSLLRRRR